VNESTAKEKLEEPNYSDKIGHGFEKRRNAARSSIHHPRRRLFMTRIAKHLSCFLALGFLLAAPLLAQAQDRRQPDNDQRRRRNTDLIDTIFRQILRQQMEGRLRGGFPGRGLPRDMEQANRLGAIIQAPGTVLVDQLDLPKQQGIVVVEVMSDSAAAKAGLKNSDILLELAGKPVPSDVDSFLKQLNEINKDTPIEVILLRKGKRETINGLKLIVGR
jgi:C-terminal processing protease CtpA/Prc